jgi:diguanylate cyclase (GGDEF)-like protein
MTHMRSLRVVPTTAPGQAAALFAAWGIVALTSAAARLGLPAALTGVGCLIMAGAIVRLPWRRWRPGAALWLIVPACAAIEASVSEDLIPIRAYGTVFVLLFAWVGANNPPRTSLKVAPALAIGYVLPVLTIPTDFPVDPRAIVAVMAVGVLIAEVVARTLLVSRDASERAERTAAIFRTVAQSGLAVRTLEPVEVLEAVADAVMALGYDGANMAIVERDGNTFRPAHARGITKPFEGEQFSLESGLTGKVVTTGETQVWRDYAAEPEALATIRSTGVRASVSVPVHTNGGITAVLHASKLAPMDPSPEDIDALTILATTAGIALENADRFGAQQAAAKEHADDALTDELTGLRNRRHAKRLLAELQPGDVVVIADLDRFKLVNDRHGHQAGDELLVRFADHVTSQMRGGDSLCRYGGEEFLIVMPRTPLAAAEVAVNRLMDSWRATRPTTTFSAGIACHDHGRERLTTLGAADEALYEAKRGGRDRCSVENREVDAADANAPLANVATFPVRQAEG